MCLTPEVRLTRLARYSRWPTFPSDPAPFYASFRSQVEVKDAISERRSFGAVTRMESKLNALDRPKLSDPQRLAVHRALHTASLELADRADDSCGVIGEMRSQAWRYYLELDWAGCGMQPEDYWADLSALVVIEQYGLGYRNKPCPGRGSHPRRCPSSEGSCRRWRASAGLAICPTSWRRHGSNRPGSPWAPTASTGSSR